jgi:hypothetical protein
MGSNMIEDRIDRRAREAIGRPRDKRQVRIEVSTSLYFYFTKYIHSTVGLISRDAFPPPQPPPRLVGSAFDRYRPSPSVQDAPSNPALNASQCGTTLACD